MAETSGISWTDATMNFWIGCTEVGTRRAASSATRANISPSR